MNNKLLIASVIVTSAILGGCANNKELQKSVGSLSSTVNQLSARVDAMESGHQRIAATAATAQSTAQAAAAEAMRANTRIDSIASSYKK